MQRLTIYPNPHIPSSQSFEKRYRVLGTTAGGARKNEMSELNSQHTSILPGVARWQWVPFPADRFRPSGSEWMPDGWRSKNRTTRDPFCEIDSERRVASVKIPPGRVFSVRQSCMYIDFAHFGQWLWNRNRQVVSQFSLYFTEHWVSMLSIWEEFDKFLTEHTLKFWAKHSQIWLRIISENFAFNLRSNWFNQIPSLSIWNGP